MTPAQALAEFIRAEISDKSYSVFHNHLPDQPIKAILCFDVPGGRLEERRMKTGKRDIHPSVQVVVRDLTPSSYDVLVEIGDLADAAYQYRLSDGQTLQVISKTNTIGSLGQSPQTRHCSFSQQFRLTIG
jgi:hypothetical protein